MAEHETLARIAELLGCSVEDLRSDDAAPPQLKGASELLSLWVQMNSDEDRDRLLAFARNLAGAG